MELTIKLAYYILTIAQEQNITHAAQKLYISQPSLTQAIQKAEQQLGEKIFYREGNALLPTRMGSKVVEACGRLVKLSRDLQNEIQDEIKSYNEHVVIGMPYNLGVHMFPKLFSIYQAEYPNVKMLPVEGKSVELEKMLLAGTVDVALIPLPLPIQNSLLTTRLLIHERMLITVKKGHPIREKAVDRGCRYPFLPMEALGTEDFVLGPEGQRNRVVIEQMFKQAHIRPGISYVCKNIDGQRLMAAAGMGFAICPEHYHKFYPLVQEADLYYPLLTPEIFWDVAMVYRNDSYLSVPTAECCRILSRFAQGLEA